MTNVSAGVHSNGAERSRLLSIRLSEDVVKRLRSKAKSKVGVKLYETKSGALRAAIRTKPDKDKGFRPITLHAQNGYTTSLYARLGVGDLLNEATMAPMRYSFTNGTLYIDFPW